MVVIKSFNIHITCDELVFYKNLLNRNNITNFKIIVEKENKKYISILEEEKKLDDLGLLENTYNEDFVKNHTLIKISNTEDIEKCKQIEELKPVRNNIYNSPCYSQLKILMSQKPLNYLSDAGEPEYPVYIISHKRSQYLYTMKCLEKMKITYIICIREDESKEYIQELEKNNCSKYSLLLMSKKWEEEQNYLGNYGSIPQRNLCWSHSQNILKKSKHWLLDDNIKNFIVRVNQRDYKDEQGINFNEIELFLKNITSPVGLIGMNYTNDYPSIDFRKRYNLNTKVYSCMLINTELLESKKIKGWRGKYNEDVRLTIECLINGLNTIGFNQYLINKCRTGSLKGGNKEIYKNHSSQGYQDKFDEIFVEYPNYISNIKKYKDERSHHKIHYNKIIKDTPNLQVELKFRQHRRFK